MYISFFKFVLQCGQNKRVLRATLFSASPHLGHSNSLNELKLFSSLSNFGKDKRKFFTLQDKNKMTRDVALSYFYLFAQL